VASLYDLNDIWIRVYVPEERFGQMGVGDKVSVKVDAFPDKIFEGTVVQLASRAEFTPRNVQTVEGRHAQVFGVKIAIDNHEQLLRLGMPADVTFHIRPPQPESQPTSQKDSRQ
jgi:HlyD family secretion protein